MQIFPVLAGLCIFQDVDSSKKKIMHPAGRAPRALPPLAVERDPDREEPVSPMGASPLPAERAEAADDGGETAMLAPTAGRGAKVPRLLDAAPDECACRRTLRRVLLSLPVQEDSTWATMRPRVVSSRAYRDLLSCVCATNGHSRPVSALRVFLDLVAARSSAGLTRSEHNRKKRVKESSRRAAGRAATATTPASARVEHSQPPARPPAPAVADAAAAAAALSAVPAGRAAAATTPAMDASVISYPTASARVERPPPPAEPAPEAVLWFDALVASMPSSKPAALPKPTSAAASAMVTIRPRKK